jgi:Predicted endonuclease distantly related to archaeal Holliday junction resolvase
MERMNKKEFGDFGEDMAAEYLVRQNCRIVTRNFRCRTGELDIVAQKDNELIICEVKTRASEAYGYPAEFVGTAKQLRIRSAAKYYIMTNRLEGMRVRFDVIEVYINQCKGAF